MRWASHGKRHGSASPEAADAESCIVDCCRFSLAFMRRILLYGFASLTILVAIVAVLPFLIPLSTYRSVIESAAEHATGRAFKINGPLRISFFPIFGLRAERVLLSNVAGGLSRDLAEADALS